MRLPSEPDLPPQINIVPMIDVIFAILTFFIMSSLFLTQSQGLPVNLPTAVTSENQPESQLVVTIDSQGNLALDQESVSVETLVERVRSQLQAGENPLVIINADTAVTHGTVVTVMDQLKPLPGIRMAIATQRP
jgi:biopolymer transport protein ExbD